MNSKNVNGLVLRFHEVSFGIEPAGSLLDYLELFTMFTMGGHTLGS
jgi:hypothetical protein